MNGINSKDRFSFAKGYRARTIFLIFDILLLGILMSMMVLPLLTVYVWTSGLAGVLLTDALQGFVILAANLVMVGAVLWAFGGPSGLAEAVMSAAGPETAGAILSILPRSRISHPSGRMIVGAGTDESSLYLTLCSNRHGLNRLCANSRLSEWMNTPTLARSLRSR